MTLLSENWDVDASKVHVQEQRGQNHYEEGGVRMKQWFKKIESLFSGGEGQKRSNTFRWLIILGLIGVGIMVFSSFINVKK